MSRAGPLIPTDEAFNLSEMLVLVLPAQDLTGGSVQSSCHDMTLQKRNSSAGIADDRTN